MADRLLEQQQQTLRLPLYTTEEQRTGAYMSAPGVADQVLVNCFPVIKRDPVMPDKPVIQIQQRAGIQADTSNVDLTSGLADPTNAYPKAILTMSQLTDIIIIAYVDVVAATPTFRIVQYRPNANTFSTLGTIATTATLTEAAYVHLSELTIGGVPYLGIVVSEAGISNAPLGNASVGYYSASSAGTMGAIAQITDVDFPSNATYNRKVVGPMVQLNNVVYVMTEDGWIHGSEPSSATPPLAQITVWNSFGYTRASSSPDKGVGLRRYKHHLVALGQNSIEFFNDQGLSPPDLPILRTEQAFINIGVVNPKGCIVLDDTLWFVGRSSSGNLDLYKLEGYTPVSRSDSSFRKLLRSQAYNFDLQVMSMHGTTHIILNSNTFLGIKWPGTANVPENGATGTNGMQGTMVYCIDSASWWLLCFAMTNDSASGLTFMYVTEAPVSSSAGRRYMVTNLMETLATSNYGAGPIEITEPAENNPEIGYNDVFRLNNTTTRDHYRIPIMISTNVYDFKSTARKFLRSLKVVCDYIRTWDPVSPTEPWNTWNTEGLYLGVGVDKTDDLSALVTSGAVPEIRREKNLITDTLYRYNFNNLGSGRNFRFFVWINSFVKVRLEELELVIAQGTH